MAAIRIAGKANALDLEGIRYLCDFIGVEVKEEFMIGNNRREFRIVVNDLAAVDEGGKLLKRSAREVVELLLKKKP